MKNRYRFIYGLLFIFLLINPLQIYAHGEDHDQHNSEHPPWLTDHDGEHEDDHYHDYEETGANWPLLSIFAAINGGFILFGVVRKYKKILPIIM